MTAQISLSRFPISLAMTALLASCPAVPSASPDSMHGGYTYVLQNHSDDGTSGQTIGGYFAADRPLEALIRGDLPGCTTISEAGSCRAIRCVGTTTLVSAGTLTARVAGSELLSAGQLESGIYAASTGLPSLVAGQTVNMTATGRVVPAFAVSAAVPEAPSMALPSTLSVSAPLSISWSPTIAAESAQLTIQAGGSPAVSVVCHGPASSGSFIVPTAVLSDLPDGNALLRFGFYNIGETATGLYQVALGVVQGRSTYVRVSR